MIVKKPPMGWNTWNTFGDKIDEKLVRETADFIVESGLRDAGYEFHVWTIDDLPNAVEAFNRGAQTLTTNCAKKLLEGYRNNR